MRFYFKTDDGVTDGGGDYYVGEGLPGHWGTKVEATTYIGRQAAQMVIDADKDRYGKLDGRINPHVSEEE